MLTIFKIAKNVVADRRGVTALEYGVIAGILCTALVAAFGVLGGKITDAFNALVF